MQDKAERRNAKKQRIREAYQKESAVIVIPAKPESTTGTGMLKVAAYCRVSTDKEMQATSFEIQRQEYEEQIKKNSDWEFVGIYADEGLSGSSAHKRKQFQEMIQDCRNGKIDLILVKTVSRFMRNQEECLKYTRELENLTPPVGVVFEVDNIDTRKPGYELHLGFYSAFAQAESENKSQSIKWSNERRWNKGIMNCNTEQFYGYVKSPDDKITIIPEEAQIIRRIYKLYNSGKNVRQIAEFLTSKSVPTFYGGAEWSQTSVRNILKNEFYCGDVIRPKTFTRSFINRKIIRNDNWQRTKFHYENHHPAIIDRELWESVQEQLKHRRFASTGLRKPLRIRTMPGVLGAFYFLDPSWDGYDLARVQDMVFPKPQNEKETSECKNLI